MFKISSNLKIAHQLKEDFYYVMASKTSSEARIRLNDWIEKAKLSELKEYEAAIRAFINWNEPILNSFDHPYSNGYTEGFNNKIKVLKRISFGLRNFDRSRNRILHLE